MTNRIEEGIDRQLSQFPSPGAAPTVNTVRGNTSTVTFISANSNHQPRCGEISWCRAMKAYLADHFTWYVQTLAPNLHHTRYIDRLITCQILGENPFIAWGVIECQSKAVEIAKYTIRSRRVGDG